MVAGGNAKRLLCGRGGEGVFDADAGDDLAGAEVLGEERGAARRRGARDDEGVPERKGVQPVKVDGAEDELRAHDDHVELGKDVDALACLIGGEAELARRDGEVFLKDLRREDGAFVGDELG